ncbi:hypothetical protein [Paraburkholderia sp. J8-2]|uniref:hypothetical protein n=1 Tax=Paraburkholderia sp. J8-2 TaxID=2805440 RepID=UPI002AB7C967|nr:hypothetical protein [Paraburkholderia sp. J8-2]
MNSKINGKKRVFVLGALDPEMRAIEALLSEQGEHFVAATFDGKRTIPSTAYRANGVSKPLPKETTSIIFIECNVFGLAYNDLIDHHQPGDPGYDMPAARYMEGSSLGQLLTMLQLEPTAEQRIVCAADHCLTQAYANQCPDVSPLELAAWRADTRAAFQGISIEAFEQRVAEAHRRLLAAETVDVAGTSIAWVGNCDQEYGEAGARYGIPFMGSMAVGKRTNVMMFGASPDVVSAWMRDCGLQDVYGAPARGYAGGYVNPPL